MSLFYILNSFSVVKATSHDLFAINQLLLSTISLSMWSTYILTLVDVIVAKVGTIISLISSLHLDHLTHFSLVNCRSQFLGLFLQTMAIIYIFVFLRNLGILCYFRNCISTVCRIIITFDLSTRFLILGLSQIINVSLCISVFWFILVSIIFKISLFFIFLNCLLYLDFII